MKLSEVLEVIDDSEKIKIAMYIGGLYFVSHNYCENLRKTRFANYRVKRMFQSEKWLEILLAPNTEEISI